MDYTIYYTSLPVGGIVLLLPISLGLGQTQKICLNNTRGIQSLTRADIVNKVFKMGALSKLDF